MEQVQNYITVVNLYHLNNEVTNGQTNLKHYG